MIKVYTGPMYSGKSKRLIEEYNKIWNKDRVICFKPSKDTRELSKIRSRDSNININAIVIRSLEDILEYVEDDITAIFIDEIQFLDGDVNVLLNLSIDRDIDIYISGLSLTSELSPFGIMPRILSIANKVEHLEAVCSVCNKLKAEYTYCLQDKSEDILVGSSMYIPICKDCLRRKRDGK